MGYSDAYRKRLTAYGTDNSNAILNSTFEKVNATFADAPNFKVVQVDGVDTDVRVLVGKTGEERHLLLRPNTKLSTGSYVTMDTRTWLVFDTIDEMFSPKSYIQACNDAVIWKDENAFFYNYKAVVTSTRNTKFDIVSDKMQVEMLQGGIYAYLPYNDITRAIRASMRFVFGDYVYEVTGVDDLTMVDENRNGIIQLSCRITPSKDGDDLENKIADNSSLYTSKLNLDNGGGSGDLW